MVMTVDWREILRGAFRRAVIMALSCLKKRAC